MNETYNLPPGLVSTTDSVVVAEAIYTYTPLIFDYFLNRTLPSGAGGPGTYTLSEKIFMKPRGQAAMLMQRQRTALPVSNLLGHAPRSGHRRADLLTFAR